MVAKSRNASSMKCCMFQKLSYNLISVSKAAKSGRTVEFSETGCEIWTRIGN